MVNYKFPKEIDFETVYFADEYKAHYIEGCTEIHGKENKKINELNLLVIYHWITIENLNDGCWGSYGEEESTYELSNAELLEYLNDNYEMENITFDEVIEIIKDDEFAIAEYSFHRWVDAKLENERKMWEERLAKWRKK